MKQMNKFERISYLYSAWTAMIIPIIIATMMLYCSIDIHDIGVIEYILGFIPVALFASIGFFMRSIFKETAKKILQYPLFKEDETRMPTTEFLLWHTSKMSKSQKRQIHQQVKDDFGITLLSEAKESQDEIEARLTIVDAVGKIRNVTRGNPILLKANYEYGFWRNLIGGLAWALAFVICMWIINVFTMSVSQWWFAAASVLILFIAAFDYYVCFGSCARYYAKQLFAAYIHGAINNK
ncbi:MAG: hypothetical protein LKI18_00505 [Prevotella sp.]|jgi:hypothetical protein|nr:hypothetical protein [Prevotella sp.]